MAIIRYHTLHPRESLRTEDNSFFETQYITEMLVMRSRK
jgi:hypothetical protein